MNEQAIRFRFGIFVLASLILLAILTILFGGFPDYFKRTESYTIMFKSVAGIAPGTPVLRSGVKIGDVRNVELDNASGEVKVVIQIGEKYYLRRGDHATIVTGLIGGDSAIAFVPPENVKNVDATPVEPGAVLNGVSPTDAAALLRKTSDLIQPTLEALTEFRQTFQRINKMGPEMEDMMKDLRNFSKTAGSLGPELQKTGEEIRLLSKATRDMYPDLKRTNEEVQVTVRTWGKVGERVDVLLRINEDKITKSIDRTEEALKRVNELFSDENQKNIRETLRNVRAGTQQLESISMDTSALIKDSRVTVKQLNETLKKADDAFGNLQKVTQPLGDQGPRIFKNLDEGTDNLNKMMRDLRELMQVVARSDGTVQKLIIDPSLYNHLNDSATMVTKILPRLDRILCDVEIFADKLARHPEVLGIGGALRPSSGLKDNPTPYRVYPIPCVTNQH